MCLFCIHPVWNNPEALSNPKDVGIHWKCFSSETEEKETMDGFWTNSFQNTHGLLDLLRTHLFQK